MLSNMDFDLIKSALNNKIYELKEAEESATQDFFKKEFMKERRSYEYVMGNIENEEKSTEVLSTNKCKNCLDNIF